MCTGRLLQKAQSHIMRIVLPFHLGEIRISRFSLFAPVLYWKLTWAIIVRQPLSIPQHRITMLILCALPGGIYAWVVIVLIVVGRHGASLDLSSWRSERDERRFPFALCFPSNLLHMLFVQQHVQPDNARVKGHTRVPYIATYVSTFEFTVGCDSVV